MTVRTAVDKALCYIVRGGELLVFRHLGHSPEEVGVQVPAGTVRAGESPEDAALREAREETGLDGFRLVRRLGKTTYDITPYRFEVQHRHVFHLALDGDAPRRWRSREHHDGTRPPTELECFWIPLEHGHVLQSGQGALLGRLWE
ncbi:NUDIX domain-containing protein [Thermobifida halotolerans]|uniref:NUDIX domain-containing protein n=1 Tax=Thermobifida halotolerans TaxID=483545 RepID=A0A399FVG0_9ACTN|nr:NUDIX domain-containing protein [Thermobifida halotolerans]UOE18866.1 NUDIX domain-containing protein [Thermobifida halotolerans]